ncbi:uncharacterized protein N7529_002923 [Penicillium soppii]|uniref:uncharacterized protein n=1 Tax=Penicillium soppii TaxID=69789 RepID=UPI0025483107|nr:uncharacterized protein N7529_002923 [Penicillium soppii]KAJ5874493.1 hypothetical protein N7529_002923 [Penicillium soppii]
MRYSIAAALLTLPLALTASLKSVVITFPNGTPESVITQAKNSLVASGGVITHEYHLINGFAAEAPASALQTLSTQDAKYNPNIEEDKIVNANGEYKAGF